MPDLYLSAPTTTGTFFSDDAIRYGSSPDSSGVARMDLPSLTGSSGAFDFLL